MAHRRGHPRQRREQVGDTIQVPEPDDASFASELTDRYADLPSHERAILIRNATYDRDDARRGLTENQQLTEVQRLRGSISTARGLGAGTNMSAAQNTRTETMLAEAGQLPEPGPRGRLVETPDFIQREIASRRQPAPAAEDQRLASARRRQETIAEAAPQGPPRDEPYNWADFSSSPDPLGRGALARPNLTVRPYGPPEPMPDMAQPATAQAGRGNIRAAAARDTARAAAVPTPGAPREGPGPRVAAFQARKAATERARAAPAPTAEPEPEPEAPTQEPFLRQLTEQEEVDPNEDPRLAGARQYRDAIYARTERGLVAPFLDEYLPLPEERDRYVRPMPAGVMSALTLGYAPGTELRGKPDEFGREAEITAADRAKYMGGYVAGNIPASMLTGGATIAGARALSAAKGVQRLSPRLARGLGYVSERFPRTRTQNVARNVTAGLGFTAATTPTRKLPEGVTRADQFKLDLTVGTAIDVGLGVVMRRFRPRRSQLPAPEGTRPRPRGRESPADSEFPWQQELDPRPRRKGTLDVDEEPQPHVPGPDYEMVDPLRIRGRVDEPGAPIPVDRQLAAPGGEARIGPAPERLELSAETGGRRMPGGEVVDPNAIDRVDLPYMQRRIDEAIPEPTSGPPRRVSPTRGMPAPQRVIARGQRDRGGAEARDTPEEEPLPTQTDDEMRREMARRMMEGATAEVRPSLPQPRAPGEIGPMVPPKALIPASTGATTATPASLQPGPGSIRQEVPRGDIEELRQEVPTTLGEEYGTAIKDLPKRLRETLLNVLASKSDGELMAQAANLTAFDIDPKQMELVQDLLIMARDRLKDAPPRAPEPGGAPPRPSPSGAAPARATEVADVANTRADAERLAPTLKVGDRIVATEGNIDTYEVVGLLADGHVQVTQGGGEVQFLKAVDLLTPAEMRSVSTDNPFTETFRIERGGGDPPTRPGVPEPTERRAAVPDGEGRSSPRRARIQDEISGARSTELEEAYRDPLTGLANQQAWRKARSRLDDDPNTELTVFDAIGLKKLNDNLGHDAGDERIVEVGKAIARIAEEFEFEVRDVFAADVHRALGDEFVVAHPPGDGAAFGDAVVELLGEGKVRYGVGSTFDEADQAMNAARKSEGDEGGGGAVAPTEPAGPAPSGGEGATGPPPEIQRYIEARMAEPFEGTGTETTQHNIRLSEVVAEVREKFGYDIQRGRQVGLGGEVETVKGVAIRAGDEVIEATGDHTLHGEIYEFQLTDAQRELVDAAGDKANIFSTSTPGRYVSRDDALRIAEEADQVTNIVDPPKIRPEGGEGSGLDATDIMDPSPVTRQMAPELRRDQGDVPAAGDTHPAEIQAHIDRLMEFHTRDERGVSRGLNVDDVDEVAEMHDGIRSRYGYDVEEARYLGPDDIPDLIAKKDGGAITAIVEPRFQQFADESDFEYADELFRALNGLLPDIEVMRRNGISNGDLRKRLTGYWGDEGGGGWLEVHSISRKGTGPEVTISLPRTREMLAADAARIADAEAGRVTAEEAALRESPALTPENPRGAGGGKYIPAPSVTLKGIKGLIDPIRELFGIPKPGEMVLKPLPETVTVREPDMSQVPDGMRELYLDEAQKSRYRRGATAQEHADMMLRKAMLDMQRAHDTEGLMLEWEQAIRNRQKFREGDDIIPDETPAGALLAETVEPTAAAVAETTSAPRAGEPGSSVAGREPTVLPKPTEQALRELGEDRIPGFEHSITEITGRENALRQSETDLAKIELDIERGKKGQFRKLENMKGMIANQRETIAAQIEELGDSYGGEVVTAALRASPAEPTAGRTYTDADYPVKDLRDKIERGESIADDLPPRVGEYIRSRMEPKPKRGQQPARPLVGDAHDKRLTEVENEVLEKFGYDIRRGGVPGTAAERGAAAKRQVSATSDDRYEVQTADAEGIRVYDHHAGKFAQEPDVFGELVDATFTTKANAQTQVDEWMRVAQTGDDAIAARETREASSQAAGRAVLEELEGGGAAEKVVTDADVSQKLAEARGTLAKERAAIEGPVAAGDSEGTTALAALFQRPAPKAIAHLEDHVPMAEPIKGPVGDETSVVFPDGLRLQARWRVSDVDDLIASHNPENWARNPNALEGTQNRRYETDKAAQDRFEKRQTKYDSKRAHDLTDEVVAGVPVARGDGHLIAGNERKFHKDRLAMREPEKWATDQEVLRSRVGKVGILPAELDDIKKPMLWREIVDARVDLESRKVIRQLNDLSDENLGKGKDAISESSGRAARLEDNPRALEYLRDSFDAKGEGQSLRAYMDTADGKEFAKRLMDDGVITEGEIPQFIDTASGALTVKGKDAIVATIRAAAIGDPKLMGIVADNLTTLANKMDAAYAPIMQASALGEFDLRGSLQESLRLHMELKDAQAKGGKDGPKNIEQLLDPGFGQQASMADALVPRGDSPTAVTLAKFLEGANKKEIGVAFTQYGHIAKVSVDEAAFTGNLFGEEPASPADAFRKVFGHVNNPKKPCR